MGVSNREDQDREKLWSAGMEGPADKMMELMINRYLNSRFFFFL